MIEFDVTIVGGGFSGSAVAANLARRAPSDFSVAVFDPDDLGRGAAYGTRHREHVLNTRAKMMSFYSDQPDDFVRWLGMRGGPNDFLSRRLYGEYVGEVAHRDLKAIRFTHVRDRIRNVRRSNREGFVVESRVGASFEARAIVLATGNPAPNDEFLPDEVRLHPGYIDDPWRFDYRVVGGEVLIVGSGLTALDVLIALRACGHRGRVHVLSRRGRFPQVHEDVTPYDVIPALDTHGAHSLLRSFRRHLDEAARRGFDWRAVIDSLRPETEAIWKRLPPVEQRRFERHLRVHWERHRHRVPPQVDAVRRAYRRTGRLHHHTGRLLRMERGTAEIVPHHGASVELRPDWIVNASGLGRVSAMRRDPLLGAMLSGGMVCDDSGGLGLRASPDLSAIDAFGYPVPGLWIVGPPARGSRFEATAVPELRAMAELVSSEILHAYRATEQAKSSADSRRPSWGRGL
ncbi:MAG: FAD/NAD(P)-binding protein [Candidatus Cybelea sp.]